METVEHMTMEGTFYCDGPNCERHARIGPTTLAEGKLIPGFLRVVEYGDAGTEHALGFCGWDCVLRYAGQKEPEEVHEL